MAGHTAGEPLECFSIPIVLEKEQDLDQQGNPLTDPGGKPRYRCGFKIGGGIDQDPSQSPQGYPDKGVYVNGKDFTLVTHKQAVESIRKKPVLKMLIYRKGVPQLHKAGGGGGGVYQQMGAPHNTQFQAYPDQLDHHHGNMGGGSHQYPGPPSYMLDTIERQMGPNGKWG
ncbi:tax1-binding protein 3 [Plakobranchus ocellatus]|uniref:Tax1-binding protein 3 n=1 Tax=Plakobranchus ocellatus TaxID=259542 RepID=A0AAV3Y318_9GAST|nr:tax1-binding protein 3 [Plakobranchus ocellatus]